MQSSGRLRIVRIVNRRRAFTRLAVLVGLALLAAACSSGDLQVSMQRSGTPVTVTVHDETGLIREVTAGSAEVPDPLPPAPAAWNPNERLTLVSVYWQSTACSDHPRLTLSGNALLLEIDPGPMASGCTATQLLPNIVTLRLGAVTDVTSITLRMTGG